MILTSTHMCTNTIGNIYITSQNYLATLQNFNLSENFFNEISKALQC